MDIRDSILEKQAEKRANIIKAFIPEDVLEKAVYADNALNQKLQRVGKEWGGKKEDDKGGEKTPKGNSEDANVKAPMAHEDIQKHLSATSTEALQKFASDKTKDAKLVEHAKRELEVRAKEESDTNEKEKQAAFAKKLGGKGTGKVDPRIKGKKIGQKSTTVHKGDETEDENLSFDFEDQREERYGKKGKSIDKEGIKQLLTDMYLQHNGIKLSPEKDVDKVADILKRQGWSVDETKKEDKSGSFENETENGEDEDETFDILGESVFNNQGKFNVKKFTDTYDKLLEIGSTPEYIEKVVGHSSWNHPQTDEEEADSYKEDWQSALNKMNTYKKIEAIDSSLKDLKKHMESKK